MGFYLIRCFDGEECYRGGCYEGGNTGEGCRRLLDKKLKEHNPFDGMNFDKTIKLMKHLEKKKGTK